MTELASVNVKDFEGQGFPKVWKPLSPSGYELGRRKRTDGGTTPEG